MIAIEDGDHIALTFDGEGNQTERFLHGTQIDQVLAQENADGEVLWALTDHQGSVRVLLDNDGNVVNNITYDAFGNITVESNPDVNFRFSYTGREYDAETGLYNYRARYYDPGVGRFISEDPMGFEAGDSNTYRYVGNNPLFYVDPSGFCGVGSGGFGVGGFSIGAAASAAANSSAFFGPAFGPGSDPGGSDFSGLGGFTGFAPGSFGVGGSDFGGFGGGTTGDKLRFDFPGDKTFEVADSLKSWFKKQAGSDPSRYSGLRPWEKRKDKYDEAQRKWAIQLVKENAEYINDTAKHYNVIPEAIAGAILWEGVENPFGFWTRGANPLGVWTRPGTPFDFGIPGKIHTNPGSEAEAIEDIVKQRRPDAFADDG
ncbi:MAG: RHS repeat-associated core domain-containing protein, partial [Hydrococcus sp. SU_1_0]|nr:RHS repeat-associated core domain-containing protein [Hydrococcus sp. SU_1_0]